MNEKKELVSRIIESLDREPERWFINNMTARFGDKLRLWVANGVWHVHVDEPCQVNFSLRQRMQLDAAVQRAAARKALAALEQGDSK